VEGYLKRWQSLKPVPAGARTAPLPGQTRGYGKLGALPGPWRVC